MNEGLVSVIMPAYNCESYIRKAIDSILNQTYSNFELLIADDCSTDNTKIIIESYTDNRIKTFHNEVNLGYLKASNKLFEKCNGDFITFQDADDYSDTTRLEKLLAFLKTNKEVACVGSNIVKVSADDEQFFTSKFYLTDTEIREAYLNYKITYTGSALMIRKEVLDTIGNYNLYFDRIGSEDTYWYSYILDLYKVANLPEALYYYRANPNSVTSMHKNPKAFVGHQLIIFLYKQRLNNKPDFIQQSNFEKVDVCCDFLILINNIKEDKSGSVSKFISKAITQPSIAKYFFREFLSLVKSKLVK